MSARSELPMYVAIIWSFRLVYDLKTMTTKRTFFAAQNTSCAASKDSLILYSIRSYGSGAVQKNRTFHRAICCLEHYASSLDQPRSARRKVPLSNERASLEMAYQCSLLFKKLDTETRRWESIFWMNTVNLN